MNAVGEVPKDWVTLGPRRLAALDIVDRMPGDLRECVHEFGLPIVAVLTRHGVKDPKAIREIVKEIWLGPRQGGQTGGALKTLDVILARGPISFKALSRMLADCTYVIAPLTPTKAMIDASLAEVSGHNVLCSKQDKHRLRLMAALKAASQDNLK